MSKLTDLIGKLKTAADKVSDVRDKFGNITQSVTQVQQQADSLDSLKNTTPGIKEAQAIALKFIEKKTGKIPAISPSIDVSPNSIASKL